MRLSSRLFLCTASILLLLSIPARAQTGNIGGTITRQSNATAVSGASVKAIQSGSVIGSTTTAGNGTYTISSLAAGTYTVRIEAATLAAVQVAGVVVTSSNTTTTNVALVSAGPITYAYDALGRLVSVTDPSTDTATYVYDAVGNITAILRGSSAAVSIQSFMPSSGLVGTTVTIAGTGFSPTANQNTVTFNGTGATVSSATATQLVVTVPVAATTGAISITTPAGSATSADNFTVTASSGAPTITSFSPTLIEPGAAVTISGTNFENVPANNRAVFNRTNAAITSASTSSLSTVSPLNVGAAGHITIATPKGAVVSSGDLYVVPPPFTTDDVAYTARLSPGVPTTIDLDTADKIALVLFDGGTGQHFALRVADSTMYDGGIEIYSPLHGAFSSDSFNGGDDFLQFPTLPETGTYTIHLDDWGNTGSVTATLFHEIYHTSAITVDEAATLISLDSPGDRQYLTFTGSEGQHVSVLLSGSDMEGDLRLRAPDNSLVDSRGFSNGWSLLRDVELPADGVYQVVIDPNHDETGSVSVVVYTPTEISDSVSVDGSGVEGLVARDRAFRVTFSGTENTWVTTLASGTFAGCWTLTLLDPNEDFLNEGQYCDEAPLIDPTLLPVSGTYTILLSTTQNRWASATVSVFTSPADLSDSLTINDSPPAEASIVSPGQSAVWTFTGTVSQRVMAWATGSWTAPGCWRLTLLDPNDGWLDDEDSCTPGHLLMPLTLPETGTYTLVINPDGAVTGDVEVSVLTLTSDPGAIVIDGATADVTPATPPEESLLSFDVTSEQYVVLTGTGSVTGSWYFVLYDSGGAVLDYDRVNGGAPELWPYLYEGTYTLAVLPSPDATGTLTVSAATPP